MKLVLVFWAILVNSIYALPNLPKNFQAILNCAAYKKSPTFVIARDQKNTFFLVYETKTKTEIHKLTIIDGDMGYSTLTFEKPNKELKKWVSYVYIYNNEEDISNYKKAIITGGNITQSDRDQDQNCKAIGKPKLNL